MFILSLLRSILYRSPHTKKYKITKIDHIVNPWYQNNTRFIDGFSLISLISLEVSLQLLNLVAVSTFRVVRYNLGMSISYSSKRILPLVVITLKTICYVKIPLCKRYIINYCIQKIIFHITFYWKSLPHL